MPLQVSDGICMDELLIMDYSKNDQIDGNKSSSGNKVCVRGRERVRVSVSVRVYYEHKRSSHVVHVGRRQIKRTINDMEEMEINASSIAVRQ